MLKQNHYIHDYKLLEDGPHPVLRRTEVLPGQADHPRAARVSKPGLRQYVGAQEIPRVRNGLGMALPAPRAA